MTVAIHGLISIGPAEVCVSQRLFGQDNGAGQLAGLADGVCVVRRERKRVQMAVLTTRTQELEEAVRVRDAEISALRSRLAAAGVAM